MEESLPVDGPPPSRQGALEHPGKRRGPAPSPPCPSPLRLLTNGTSNTPARNSNIIYRRAQDAQHARVPDVGRKPPVVSPGLAAEEQLGGRAHHLGAPHRVEGELGVHGLYALYRESLRLDLLLNEVPNRAHGAREAESNVDVAAIVVHADIVDQT